MLNRRQMLLLPPAALLAGCATDVVTHPETGQARLVVQNPGINPRSGGWAATPHDLRPGDIVLSSTDGLPSIGIRLLTLAPVSHASLYVGDDQIAEAVGHGIQQRTVARLLEEESTVVAFRHPAVQTEHVTRMRQFVAATLGQKYNLVGVLLQAPFSVERRVCELPLLPGMLREACLQGFGAVQLGLGRSDRFFCSQFVLEAYRQAGLPLTDADPRMLSPGDLLRMREDDVPAVRVHRPLQYVGHLKYEPQRAAGRTPT